MKESTANILEGILSRWGVDSQFSVNKLDCRLILSVYIYVSLWVSRDKLGNAWFSKPSCMHRQYLICHKICCPKTMLLESFKEFDLAETAYAQSALLSGTASLPIGVLRLNLKPQPQASEENSYRLPRSCGDPKIWFELRTKSLVTPKIFCETLATHKGSYICNIYNFWVLDLQNQNHWFFPFLSETISVKTCKAS